MNLDTFNSAWIVYYDSTECAYDVMPGLEWLKRDRDSWLHQRMPTRVMLDVAESERAAIDRLKDLSRKRRAEAIAAA
jgi:hypothetical protein